MNDSKDVTVTERADAKFLTIIYGLYLAGLIFWITALIGLVMAYVTSGNAPAWQQSHYRFQIRTFWIALLFGLISALLSFIFIFIGFITGALTTIWFIVRCVKGLMWLGQDREVPDPAVVEQIAAQLQGQAIGAVNIGIFDIDARFRLKRVSTETFLKLLSQGHEFCKVLYNWDVAEVPYGQGDWADVPCPIDPSTGRVFPFAEGEAMGFAVTAGFEYEYFILDETPAQRARERLQRPSILAARQSYLLAGSGDRPRLLRRDRGHHATTRNRP